jgi:hypothetical protein
MAVLLRRKHFRKMAAMRPLRMRVPIILSLNCIWFSAKLCIKGAKLMAMTMLQIEIKERNIQVSMG